LPLKLTEFAFSKFKIMSLYPRKKLTKNKLVASFYKNLMDFLSVIRPYGNQLKTKSFDSTFEWAPQHNNPILLRSTIWKPGLIDKWGLIDFFYYTQTRFSIIGNYEQYSTDYFTSYHWLFCVILDKTDCK